MPRRTSAGVLLLVGGLAVVPAAHASPDRSLGAPTAYRIYATQARSSEPVRWNPCAAITYKVNRNGLAGRAARARVRRAVAEAARVSGIPFRYAGTTRFVPDDRLHPVPPGVGADVVITWAYPGHGRRRSALLAPIARLAGVGGYAVERSNSGYQLARTGFVVFDAHRIFRMSSRKQYVVALHELGHVLGLDDVRDPREVMNAVVLGGHLTHYGPGDRAGLARLGRRAGCLAPAGAPRRPEVSRVGDQLRVVTTRVGSVSGAVTYTLSSADLGGRVASSTEPAFWVPLTVVARSSSVGRVIHLAVTAANRVGDGASLPVAYRVPAAALRQVPAVEVTPTTFDAGDPVAVLAGTDVDITDQLTVTNQGTITVHKTNGSSFETGLSRHMVLYGTTVASYEVVGSVRVQGPGLDRTFDLSGTYPTGAQPHDQVTSAPGT